jgi:3-phosphoshikimate 1-carboxyvinyltransferase
MNCLELKTKNSINAELDIPGSKSYANRALVIAALAKGTTILKNVPSCDDVYYMIEAIKKLGVKTKKISDDEYEFISPEKFDFNGELFVGFAGTTSRFLTTLLTLNNGRVKLYGENRLHERPVEDLVKAIEENIDGTITAENKTEKNERCLPLIISSNGLKGGKIKLKGNTSSQYLTSILLSSPKATNPVEIEIVDELTSKSYADITIDVMKAFGIIVQNNNYENFFVPKKDYIGREYFIEIDGTGANYFLAITAVVGGKIKINNINPNSAQGDIKFIDILEEMGCKIIKGDNYFELESNGKLKAVNVDMNSLPDSAQTLAVVAAFAKGKTKITGLATLKVKETNRLLALKNELEKCGIKTEIGDDYIIVEGGNPIGAQIKTYDDHRMAMSFSIMGAKIQGVKIEDPNCVSKSFPEFWEFFEKI